MARNKNYRIYFKVKGFRKLQLEDVKAPTMLDALVKFQEARPFAVPQECNSF